MGTIDFDNGNLGRQGRTIAVEPKPRQRFRPLVRRAGKQKQDQEGGIYERNRGRGVGVAVERHGNLLGWGGRIMMSQFGSFSSSGTV